MSVIINASTSSGLIQTADTSGTLVLQSNGTTQLTVSSTGVYGQLKSGTAQASTSGTSIDFTSIPSWVKRITVMFSGVSTNGTSAVQIQVGSGSVTTSGYSSIESRVVSTVTAATTYTSGFVLSANISAAGTLKGMLVIANITSNTWVATGAAYSRGDTSSTTSGEIALGGTLDRIRITTVNGTDTFDAGSINILYEG